MEANSKYKETVARFLYNTYCEAAGWKAYNQETLRSWEIISTLPQGNYWREVSKKAIEMAEEKYEEGYFDNPIVASLFPSKKNNFTIEEIKNDVKLKNLYKTAYKHGLEVGCELEKILSKENNMMELKFLPF